MASSRDVGPGAGAVFPQAVGQAHVAHGPSSFMSQKNTVAPAAAPAATGVTNLEARARMRENSPGGFAGGAGAGGTRVSGGRTGAEGSGGASGGASLGTACLPSGSQYATGF